MKKVNGCALDRQIAYTRVNMASGDSVQMIKERLSIVDVVSPYVELHQAGKHMKGKSPFVNEKTPSFMVSPDRGMYYCFSSSQGGDIFTFVQTMEGVDFKEALKILAEKAGVELVAEDPKKRTERETGYVVLDSATSFFEEKGRESKEVGTYLTNRGVTPETIAKWRIGYAPGPPNGGWRELRAHLSGEKKYTDAQMLSTGLIKGGVDGKEPYDLFRDRIMFPLFDAGGKVIAFSGRILEKDSEAPKYVNSPETNFFNKSEVLYGYDKAKQGIRKFDFSLIVEGQFDVVLCHQAGYSNTVAVSGTGLTQQHVGLLQRLSNRVVLALDADRAGIAAVKRAADLMLVRGIDVKVAHIPDGQDPADLIKDDPQKFKDVIGKATHVIEFLLLVLKDEAKDERTYKLRARDEILPYILKMQNKIDAEHFQGVIAEAIGTTKDAVQLEVARLIEQERNKPTGPAPEEKTVVSNETAPAKSFSRKDDLLEHVVVASELLDTKDRDIVRSAVADIMKEDFSVIKDRITPEQSSKLLFSMESETEGKKLRFILEEFNANIHELRLLVLREKLREQKELLYAAEREDQAKTVETLLQSTTELQKELAKASVLVDIFEKEEFENPT
ncbi:MAG: DNA primase [Candidatus Azotimanducaceae bacterium]|jgi:DNA primase